MSARQKELIVDYLKWKANHAPNHIDWGVMERVEHFKFLSAHIT
jgi:hypothetical protein